GRSQLWPNGKMRQGPAYVFDKAAVGFSVLAESDLEDPAKAKHLIVGKTTASADGVEFKEGDILPAHILDSAKAKGSAADVDYAKGSLDNGTYTVVMRRKLDTGNPLDDKILEPDTVYTFGFSVHDDAAGKRAHVVSFPVTLSIGEGEADIQTVTLD
ncbi:MAG: ethylbenzene dehydrogenase-related protein, partial [Rhodospirillales bacterium]|nr:ethylbenzene dehydrogenase-related protein [Rhodospirillales bacterium]